MYDYSQDIYIELQDINDNLQAFIQQENNNNDSLIACFNTNSYSFSIYIGCIALLISVFNLIHLLPRPTKPLQK